MTDYFDLGEYSRNVSKDKQSQTWFDRGMGWLFAYNHEEAISCLRKPLKQIMSVHLGIGVSHMLLDLTTTSIGRFLPPKKKHPF